MSLIPFEIFVGGLHSQTHGGGFIVVLVFGSVEKPDGDDDDELGDNVDDNFCDDELDGGDEVVGFTVVVVSGRVDGNFCELSGDDDADDELDGTDDDDVGNGSDGIVAVDPNSSSHLQQQLRWRVRRL